MKFVAPKIDLDLELVTLSGEEVFIEGPKAINADQAVKIAEKMDKETSALMKKPSASGSMDVAVKFLIDVYGKDEAFWTGNFPPETLGEIRRWFLNQITGVKKKD